MHADSREPAPGSAPPPKMAHGKAFWLSVSRVEALTDGIFAIAMTLLVLSITVPDVPKDNANAELKTYLSQNWYQFEHYAISFLLLATFWIRHHRQFRYIKRVNEAFLWMNILALMLVAVMPFSTSFMSDYNEFQIPNLVFMANMLAIGVAFFFMWYYATSKYRLIDRNEIGPDDIYFSRLLNLVSPALSVVGIGVTFISPPFSEMVYIAIPFVIFVLRRTMRSKKKTF